MDGNPSSAGAVQDLLEMKWKGDVEQEKNSKKGRKRNSTYRILHITPLPP
jgi:hypothetical protein